MLWIGVDLCNSIFYWNLKWSMSSVTLTHTDLDLCFQGHIRKKWMHNITLVNITIQPYFVISNKHFAMHLCSNYGILLPLKHLSLTDWKNKIYFLYKDNKIFKSDFSLSEQNRTIIVLRRNKICFRNICAQWSKIHTDCKYTMNYQLSEATTAPRKVIIIK